ncbi:MAG: S16 family serine protease, partial [Pseudomonadota bacterium]
PLFLLDEIDKMGQDFRGDPSSALLEVLDPAQNDTFSDHYLEVEYDLSDVMFITTANSLNMPQPLLDRMEIIRIPGYTEDEKVEIARRHLMKKQEENHGLKKGEFTVTDEGLLKLIRLYTREAGVRNLEREIANLARKAVRKLEQDDDLENVTVDEDNLSDFAGVPKYRYGEIEGDDIMGVVTGLAWTESGGDILKIEAVTMPGKGRMTPTGNLKDVMKESVSAAASYVRSRAIDFGIKQNILDCMAERGIYVKVFPAKTDFKTLKAFKPDGYFMSNGPGDPGAMDYAVAVAKDILKEDKPLFGICLGHQILALSLNGKTKKMKLGHRGANHPVKNQFSQR